MNNNWLLESCSSWYLESFFLFYFESNLFQTFSIKSLEHDGSFMNMADTVSVEYSSKLDANCWIGFFEIDSLRSRLLLTVSQFTRWNNKLANQNTLLFCSEYKHVSSLSTEIKWNKWKKWQKFYLFISNIQIFFFEYTLLLLFSCLGPYKLSVFKTSIILGNNTGFIRYIILDTS